MKNKPKPAPHPMVTMLASQNEIWLVHATDSGSGQKLTPDEAVALGYALFNHGLYLNGRIKQGSDLA